LFRWHLAKAEYKKSYRSLRKTNTKPWVEDVDKIVADSDYKSALARKTLTPLTRNLVPVLTLICLGVFAVLAFVILRGMPERLSQARCAGPDQAVAVGETVRLVGNGKEHNSGRVDPDGNTLNYRWDLVLKPDGSSAELSDPNRAEANFTADVAGTYTATLTVKDFKGCYPGEWVTVTSGAKGPRLIPEEKPQQADEFGPNERPIADAGPSQSVVIPNGIYLDGKGSSDPDGHTLTYSWIVRRPDGTKRYLSDTVVYRLRPEVAGIYEATLTVCDGILCDTDSVSITTTDSR
jgi:hypothetical protein